MRSAAPCRARAAVAAAALAALAACQGGPPRTTGAAAVTPDSGSSTAVAPTPGIGPESYGDVRVGMTPAEASEVLRVPLAPAQPGQEAEPCHYVFPNGAVSATIAFMVSNGRIARFDTTSLVVPSADGARVGDSEATLLARYGERATVTPHKYGDADDHYVSVYVLGGTHALVYETMDGVVTAIRGGRRPEVEYVEGCS